jgi:hypothetical protein
MPVLCDFTVITGAAELLDEEFNVGVGASDDVEERSLRLAFNTGGRRRGGGAVLMFSVKGLTRTDSHPEVSINGQRIGEIATYEPNTNPEFPDNTHHWYSQLITFDASILSNRDGRRNTLEITSVGTMFRDREGTREDFTVKNIICFFHQSA